jgi:hypothetical protein
MKRKRYSGEQIAFALRQAEAGIGKRLSDRARKYAASKGRGEFRVMTGLVVAGPRCLIQLLG